LKLHIVNPDGDILIEKEAEKLYNYDLKLKDLTEIKGHIMRFITSLY